MRRTLFLFVLRGLVTATGSAPAAADGMNAVAERCAHLVLALGQHDPDYVDAFYGPAEWKSRQAGSVICPEGASQKEELTLKKSRQQSL